MLIFGGLDWSFWWDSKIRHGICPGCDQPLSATRTNAYTCNDECKRKWIDGVVARIGPYKHITSVVTGKTYLVPTRIICEVGIKEADLLRFPEVRGIPTEYPRE